jgi:hypothetical protein
MRMHRPEDLSPIWKASAPLCLLPDLRRSWNCRAGSGLQKLSHVTRVADDVDIATEFQEPPSRLSR